MIDSEMADKLREVLMMEKEENTSQVLIDALKQIRSQALNHPCCDLNKFEQRDWDGLVDEGGDVCDWTGLAITADEALKEIGLNIQGGSNGTDID